MNPTDWENIQSVSLENTNTGVRIQQSLNEFHFGVLENWLCYSLTGTLVKRASTAPINNTVWIVFEKAQLVIFSDEYFMQLRRNQDEPDTALFRASWRGADTLIRRNEMRLNRGKGQDWHFTKQISKQEHLGGHGPLERGQSRWAAEAHRGKIQVSN